MEIQADSDYKAQKIRGFCHLYDGQEAVAVGMEAAITKEDSIMAPYRCHGLQLQRGSTVKGILSELYGKEEGDSMGKGGSMHFYSKKNRFWGGSGIVGATGPIGTGIAFAQKYLAKTGPAPIAIAMYGDGAANQGQIYEAANMAKLWGIPIVYLTENNQYGMGTSTDRSTANPFYYLHGSSLNIPGIKCDGMDVLAVKKCLQWIKAWMAESPQPIYLEMKTYRYHGHSMSDPGITYRTREEIQKMRQTRDCIDLVKQRILEAEWATEAELKAVEKEIRAEVTEAAKAAAAGREPRPELLFEHIFHEGRPSHIRMPNAANSVHA
jgi:pyruvate dehydrogenase E1 component alpha subunit